MNSITDGSIVVLKETVNRQAVYGIVERAFDAADVLRQHGMESFADEFETAFIRNTSSDGLSVTVPVVMEKRNDHTDVSFWIYSDKQGFIIEGLDIQGFTRAACAETSSKAAVLLRKLR